MHSRGKECNEHQEAVIHAQNQRQLDAQEGVQEGSYVSPPNCRPKKACAAVQEHQQVVGFCDAPVLVTIVQHAYTNTVLEKHDVQHAWLSC